MRLVLLGPPGVGKGTQAARLAARFGVLHISTGDILREAISSDSPLGREARGYVESGRLVPDATVLRITEERLSRPDAASRWLLDGFPRTVAQAEALDEMLARRDEGLSTVLWLHAATEAIVERLSGRRTCAECGTLYHVRLLPPRREGRCDRCGEALLVREDDRPEAVRRRLVTYEDATAAVVDYYRGRIRKRLHEIDGNGAPEEVGEEIARIVGGL